MQPRFQGTMQIENHSDAEPDSYCDVQDCLWTVPWRPRKKQMIEASTRV